MTQTYPLNITRNRGWYCAARALALFAQAPSPHKWEEEGSERELPLLFNPPRYSIALHHPPHSRKLLMEIFEIGQVVRLKSGSPKMTIKGPGGDAADAIWAVQWIDRNGKLQGDSFHEDMLDIFVKSDRPDTARGPRGDRNRDPRFR